MHIELEKGTPYKLDWSQNHDPKQAIQQQKKKTEIKIKKWS